MSQKLHITINAARVRLEIPEQKWVFEQENRIAYDRQSNKMLALGESEETLQAQQGAEWPAFRRRAVFERLFEQSPAGPVFDYFALEFWLSKAEAAHGRSTILRPNELWDIDLKLDSEEKLSKGRRLELIYYLQERAKTLWINGKEYTIALSRRRLETGLRLLLTMILPLLALYFGLQANFSGLGEFDWQNWRGLVLAVGAALLIYLVGIAAWMLLARRWLPGGYLRYQLRRVRLPRRLARWLAARLLP